MDLGMILNSVGQVKHVVLLYLAVRIAIFLLQLIYAYILPKLGFGCNLRKYGEWAVVTGATDGIGKEYALQLAEKGFSIVLISRSRDKLDKVAEEIISKYKVMTKTITYDFNRTDGYGMIENQLKGLDIGILVNNVGTTYENIVGHDECDLSKVFSLLNINIGSSIGMTHIVRKKMELQNRGLIIYISSLLSEISVPFASCYAGSKVFLHKFSRCLSFDRNKNIDHQIVAVGPVVTKLSGVKESFSSPMPYRFVKSALGTAGLLKYTHGYWVHDVLGFLTSLSPEAITGKFVLDELDKIRKKN